MARHKFTTSDGKVHSGNYVDKGDYFCEKTLLGNGECINKSQIVTDQKGSSLGKKVAVSVTLGALGVPWFF